MAILKLINEQRKALGAHPLDLDPKLNELAQKHSEDMAKNKFSGHKNQKGQTHKERAKAMGIKTLIGENIVVDKNIELGQNVLNNSPVHLRNTINLNWEFVGIGISKGDDGLYYMTQDFSSRNIEIDPLS